MFRLLFHVPYKTGVVCRVKELDEQERKREMIKYSSEYKELVDELHKWQADWRMLSSFKSLAVLREYFINQLPKELNDMTPKEFHKSTDNLLNFMQSLIVKNFSFGIIGHVITGSMIIFAVGPISYGGIYLGLISLYRLDILGEEYDVIERLLQVNSVFRGPKTSLLPHLNLRVSSGPMSGKPSV